MFDDFDHPLRWDCAHSWVNLGQPMAHYTSNNTSTMPPATAYRVVRARCRICNGIGITTYDPRNDKGALCIF